MSGPRPVLKPAWWIVLLALAISLMGIVDHDLWTPDEPREGAISLRMAQSGEMVVPYLADKPFVEKPPLFYMMASQLILVVGPWLGNTAAIRLTSALCGLGALLFTFLIGRRLAGAAVGTLALLALATMPGFIHITHWALSDDALLLFTAASAWALTEAAFTGRFIYLPLAGLAAAGTFLAKGLVGPLIVGLIWFGFVLEGHFRPKHPEGSTWPRIIVGYVLAAMVFAGVAGSWMVLFWTRGGPDLWHEWFWNNNFGRFTGASTDRLGHRQGPFYYLYTIPLYILPWLPVWLAGTWQQLRTTFRERRLPEGWGMLLVWCLGGLLMLTASSTKREIYLGILLPAMAVMTALSFRLTLPRWIDGFIAIWQAIMLGLLAAAMLAPITMPEVRPFIPSLWFHSTMATSGFILGLALLLYRRLTTIERFASTTALTLITFLAISSPIIDRFKSYDSCFMEAADRIAAHPGTRTATYGLDETTIAGFYYYTGLAFPSVADIGEAASVIKGTHPRYDSLLILSKNKKLQSELLPRHHELMRVTMGRTRVLQWLTHPRQ